MEASNHVVDLVVDQGRNVLVSMKDLKAKGKKQGRERTKLYERFTANLHSFNVYTYIDDEIENLREVIAFQEKVGLFNDVFKEVATDYAKKVDLKHADTLYEEVVAAYNTMIRALGVMNMDVNATSL